MQAEQGFKQIKKSIMKNQIMRILSSLIDQNKQNKQNVTNKNNLIEIKQNIQGDLTGYFINIGSDIKLRKQTTRKLLQLQSNTSKRVIYGILFQRKQPQLNKNQNKQPSLTHNIIFNSKTQQQHQQLFIYNILIKFHASQFPYISMFCTNCVMSILKMYSQKCNIKDNLRVCWKNFIYLGNVKIGQLSIMNYQKKDEIYTNIGFKIKLDYFTKNYQQFGIILLEEFIGEINVAINLAEVAMKIKQIYSSSLMYIGENVIIKTKNQNHQQQIIKGKFQGVNNAGHAIINQIQKNQIITIEQGNMIKQYPI